MLNSDNGLISRPIWFMKTFVSGTWGCDVAYSKHATAIEWDNNPYEHFRFSKYLEFKKYSFTILHLHFATLQLYFTLFYNLQFYIVKRIIIVLYCVTIKAVTN